MTVSRIPLSARVVTLSPTVRYAIAVGAAALGILVRLALEPLWGSALPYITSIVAVILSAWMGGFGPGVMTTVLSAAAASFLWLAPPQSWLIDGFSQWLGLALFVAVGIAISALNEVWPKALSAVGTSSNSLDAASGSRHRAHDPQAADDARDRALRELAAIVESSDDAIVSKSLDSVIQSWNRGAERMFGYSAAEAVGKSIHIIIPEDRWNEEDEVLRHIRRGQKVDHFETVRHRKDGSDVYVSLTISPIRSANGTVIGASKIARDITERKRAEQERSDLLNREQSARVESERAGRVKDDFLATLSHELRTPLNAVLGYSQLLGSGALTPDRFAHALLAIQRNAQAQARLIESLLDLSRIMAGKFELTFGELDLRSVLDTAIDVIQPEADAKGVTLVFERPSEPVRLIGDEARLQQVFWNLVSNAIKFTPRDGHVSITVGATPDGVQVRIADDGQGISPDFLPHVFDRFAQAANGKGQSQKGLGLGLSLVRDMIEAHGGTVVAESAGEGHGSTFSVTLPLTPPARTSAAAMPAYQDA